MKRAVFLAVLGLTGVLAPSASAYLSLGNPADTATATSATFGPLANTLVINANKADGTQADSTGTGTLSISGTDANGTHSYDGTIECFNASPSFTDAGVLARVSNPVGEPATLYGVLVHLTDPEDQGSENGTGDKVDVTNLNQAQYNRQKSAGCAGAPAKSAVTAGNITITFGVVISFPPCFPFCSSGLDN